MNSSLLKPWLLVIEVPDDCWAEHSYTVCGFDTREQAIRDHTYLRRMRALMRGDRIEGDTECLMRDGNIVMAGQIGTMHLFRRDEQQP